MSLIIDSRAVAEFVLHKAETLKHIIKSLEVLGQYASDGTYNLKQANASLVSLSAGCIDALEMAEKISGLTSFYGVTATAHIKEQLLRKPTNSYARFGALIASMVEILTVILRRSESTILSARAFLGLDDLEQVVETTWGYTFVTNKVEVLKQGITLRLVVTGLGGEELNSWWRGAPRAALEEALRRYSEISKELSKYSNIMSSYWSYAAEAQA